MHFSRVTSFTKAECCNTGTPEDDEKWMLHGTQFQKRRSFHGIDV
jgi:hypothetical protein